MATNPDEADFRPRAADVELTIKVSPAGFADTVARLEAELASRDLTVFAVIDHGGEAERAGLSLRETKVVIFGNPRGGTPVMEEEPLAALDLPLKVLIWSDGEQTRLAYLDPRAFELRYGISREHGAPLTVIDEIADAVVAQ
jgi:uncharacterized protein (DUF302 family)